MYKKLCLALVALTTLASPLALSDYNSPPYPFSLGGTGQTTQQAALDALAGGSTTTGYALIYDGSHWGAAAQTGGGGSTSSTATAAYTPTYGADFGTVTGSAMYWYRLGDQMYVYGNFTTGTLSNVTAGGISLAGSHTIDASTPKIGSQSLGSPCTTVGHWATDSASAGFTGNVLVCASTSTSVVYLSNQVSGNRNTTAGSFYGIGFSNNFMTVDFHVPISGWTNSN